MEYREARPPDTGEYMRLRALLWPDMDPEREALHVRSMFDGDSPWAAVAFLAIDGDRPVGFAEISLRSYVPGAAKSPTPFLEGWYVEEIARGRGVGRALVAAAERWARERGFDELGSDTDLDNDDGAAAHEAIGFREIERIRCFLKPLNR